MNDDFDLAEFLSKAKILPDDEYQRQLREGAPLLCPLLEDGGFDSFPDSMVGQCKVCNKDIYFRPYNQVATLKLCIYCAMKLGQTNEAGSS